jgi:hypothetical protein
VLCRNYPDVQKLIRGEVGKLKDLPGPTPGDVGNTNNSADGNTATYALRRLKRDNPELVEWAPRARVGGTVAPDQPPGGRRVHTAGEPPKATT